MTPGPGRRHTTNKQKTKKLKTAVVPHDAFASADKCAETVEAALEAMEPSLEVHSGIPRLIAEFAQPYGKCSER